MMADRMQAMFKRIGPVRTTFLASLLLSWIAVQGRLVNRDGILYLDTARTYLEQGFGAAQELIGFNFLPLLIAAFTLVTPFGTEGTAYLLDALLMAGACALLVHWVGYRSPEAAWAACLVVLSMPAFNQYRSDILREYGFWFFSLAGLWLAMRWHETSRWQDALTCQLALLVAALFRLEALAFFLALTLWQVFSAPCGARPQRCMTINLLPVLGAVFAGLLVASDLVTLPHRVDYYLTAANPLHKLQLFSEAGTRFNETVLMTRYSREEAAYILLFGLLSLIPLKFINLLGLHMLPVGYQLYRLPIRASLSRWQPLPWAFLVYALVLSAFVTHQFFLSARYASMLNWLAVPVAATGLALLWTGLPRWRLLIVGLLILSAIANVISLGPGKAHVADAGKWLAQNLEPSPHVCLNNSRLAYYAGWRIGGVFASEKTSDMLDDGQCEAVVIEVRRGDAFATSEALVSRGFSERKRFVGKSGDVVIVAVK